MVRGKKGAELPMNAVVLAIIAVLVLVILAAIFIGGTKGPVATLRNLFGITTEGQTIEIAKDSCSFACNSVEGSENSQDSYYCKHVFEIDTNGDGNIESGELFVCDGNNYNSEDEEVQSQLTINDRKTTPKELGVKCSVKCK